MLLILRVRSGAFYSPSVALLRQYETEKFPLRISSRAREVICHGGAGVCFARKVLIGEEGIHFEIRDPLVFHVFLDHLLSF